MCKFSNENKQKLGNAIVYIASHTKQLSKTKLLKLLYLMEEYMVKRYHLPFLSMPYEVWQAGPVAKDVFIDLSDGPFLLKDFVKTVVCEGGTFILPICDFSDDEFMDCEIDMMDDILHKYGAMTAKQLVAETHKPGTLWYQEAEKHGLLEAFRNHECNNLDFRIDFSRILPECAAEDYKRSLEIRETANELRIKGSV